MVVEVNTIDELKKHVTSSEVVRAVGGGSKPGLSCNPTVSLRNLSGIVEYRADEYTVTALAGTPIAQIDAALAEKGQYLPFDPPLSKGGATLGGTVASGVSGPGRWRYGGIRDFIISLKMISGAGEMLVGGAKVVKNAAGFDLPKLMVGAKGRFGIMTELTFKVFPRPKAMVTLELRCGDADAAVNVMGVIAMGPWDLISLEMSPPDSVWVRLGGLPEAIETKIQRFTDALPEGCDVQRYDDDESIWSRVKEFEWVDDQWSLVKLAITPGRIRNFERYFCSLGRPTARRYGCGGNVLYLGLSEVADFADPELASLPGVALRGEVPPLAPAISNLFLNRLCSIFDPQQKFAEKSPIQSS